MSASEKLAALQQAVLTPPGEDDDYAEIVLEHERGSSGFNVAGAEAAKTVLNALPALVALVAAAETVDPEWNGDLAAALEALEKVLG